VITLWPSCAGSRRVGNIECSNAPFRCSRVELRSGHIEQETGTGVGRGRRLLDLRNGDFKRIAEETRTNIICRQLECYLRRQSGGATARQRELTFTGFEYVLNVQSRRSSLGLYSRQPLSADQPNVVKSTPGRKLFLPRGYFSVTNFTGTSRCEESHDVGSVYIAIDCFRMLQHSP